MTKSNSFEEWAASISSESSLDLPSLIKVGDSGKPIIDLSHSGMGSINHCPRKRQITKTIYHPDSNWGDSPATICGTAYHKFLQEWLVSQDSTKSIFELFKAYDWLIIPTLSAQQKDTHNPYNLLSNAIWSLDHLSYNTTQLAYINNKPAVEFSFKIIMSHSDWSNEYHYTGAIDLTFQDPHTGSYTVSDIKTTSSISNNLEAEYRHSMQLIPYGLVMNHLPDQDKQSSFMVNYTVLRLHRTDPEVVEFNYHKTQEDVKRWLEYVTDRISLIERWSNRPHWPLTGQSCMAWFKPCRYFDMCELPDNTLQDLLLGSSEPVMPNDKVYDLTINLSLDN